MMRVSVLVEVTGEHPAQLHAHVDAQGWPSAARLRQAMAEMPRALARLYTTQYGQEPLPEEPVVGGGS